MTYAQYQVWFHAFNNAYMALCRMQSPPNLSLVNVRDEAERVAGIALKKFEEVKMPDAPNMDGIDLQGLVNQVAKNVTGKKQI